METVIRKAQDPITAEEYEVELPAHEVVRKAILELNYPPDGIRVIDATHELSEKFLLSDKQKNAKRKRGERYLDVFRYDIVAPAFKYLLNKEKLKQPSGRGKPYVLPKKILPSRGECIEENYQNIRRELAIDLLLRIKDNSAAFFEDLVIDLLVAMGYGGSREDAQAVGRSGDGGIDGIINEDRLGLDVIYVQAKRWQDGNVGEPDIARFAGALAARGANKGIFITTSDFTRAAKAYDAAGFKIILINGSQLAQYMIDHNVGVSVEKTYEIKRVDSDYFAEDTE